ncbi:hypothetical protein CYMTET_4250 [Cymbomonas tetramitiformis]|uniref:NACHT domain-containing protein n=1 Tax=Cymbomonas tetramitiformis TaxID=36881 RepID=A0AAE0H1U3_9CHLO|nr:hypothetical protein CYMTET_4250 [Cymbomonas tetramitiformis]
MGCGRLAKPEKPLHHDKDFAGDNFVSIKDAIASPATELDKTRDLDAALTWVVTQAADSVSETDVKGGSAAGSPDGELGGIKSGAVLRDLDARELDTAEQLQVVVEKRTKLLEVLCYASQANAARAQEELAKVHTAAVQVAWVALETGSGAAEAPAVEDIIKLVDTLFQVLRQCALKPALVARVVGTLRCVQWLVLPAMRRVGVKQMDGEKWAREAREVRRICARMPRPRNITGSPALLELSLTRIEMTLSQLPGPGVAQTAGVVMKVAFGLGQLLLTGTGANTVVSGVKNGAKVLTSAARKALHKECFTELARMDVLAAAAAAARRRCPPGSPAEEVYGWVEDVQKLHFARLPDGCWEPVPGRWEPKAAFAGLLGDLAMEGLKSGVCDTALLERLCLGEPSQVGLAQLLRLGLSDTLSVDGKVRERATMLLLTEWVQRALLEEWSPEQWAKDGSAFLQARLGLLAQEAHAQLVSATASLKAEAERIAALDWSRPTNKLRREAQQLLAAAQQAVDATRAALRQLGGSAEALRNLLRRALTVLHTICALGQPGMAHRAALVRLAEAFGLQDELAPERLQAWLETEVHGRLGPSLEVPAARSDDPARGEGDGGKGGGQERAAGLAEVMAEEVLGALRDELAQKVLQVAAVEARVNAAPNRKAAAHTGSQARCATELSAELGECMEATRAAVLPALQELLAEVVGNAEAGGNKRESRGADAEAAAQVPQSLQDLTALIEKALGGWRSALEGRIQALVGVTSAVPNPTSSWLPPGHLLLDLAAHTEATLGVIEMTAKAACDCEAELARLGVVLERAEAAVGAREMGSVARGVAVDELVREARQLAAMILEAAAGADAKGRGEEQRKACGAGADAEQDPADGHWERREVGWSLWCALGALRWLTTVQLADAAGEMEGVKEKVKEEVEKALKAQQEAVTAAQKELENALLEMKVAAMEQLEHLAASVREAGESVVAGIADTAIGEVCGALLAPMTGLLGEVVRAGAAWRDAELWQVREVAAVVTLQSGAGWDREGVEHVRQELQACVMQSLAYEPVTSVRAVLLRGEALAAELNLGAVKVKLAAGLAALEKARAEAEREAEPLKKQERLLACREALASLAGVSRNVQDIGSALQVTMAFLTGMDTKLDAVGASLDALQAEVRELREDVRRLVGRPVLEEIWEQMERSAAGGRRLRERVYIPARGVHGGEDGKFEPDKDTNPPKDLLDKVRDEFLSKEEKSVLLLSGPAGSDKTTFVEQLVLFLEREYVKKRAGEEEGAEGAPVLLVKASLPTLQNPLTDLFAEALRRSMQLREAQIHELRELAQQGKCRLLFLLDAYDELQTKHQFKNLYMTNNFEQPS